MKASPKSAEAIPNNHSHATTTAPDLKPKADIFTAAVTMDKEKDCCCSKMGLTGKIVVFVLAVALIGGGWYYNRKEDLLTKTKASLMYC